MLRSVHVLIDRYIKCTFDALHIHKKSTPSIPKIYAKYTSEKIGQKLSCVYVFGVDFF